MKRNNSKETTTSKLFGNKFAPTFVFAVIMAVFAFLPSGFAKINGQPEDSCKTESSKSYQVAPKLPAEWVWEKKAINFDHMFRTKR
jgi:hypothetical protein